VGASSARALIEKIIESEKKIRNWEVRVEYTHSNGYKQTYDDGYDHEGGRKYQEGATHNPAHKSRPMGVFTSHSSGKGMGGMPVGEPVGVPESTTTFKRVFDGEKCYKLEDSIATSQGKVINRGKEGAISASMNFGTSPATMLGWEEGSSILGGRQGSLGENLLCHLERIRIRQLPENIDGHLCTVIEVPGIPYAGAKEDAIASHDLYIWIDTQRDFRPLKFESYWERYHSDVDTFRERRGDFGTTELKEIDGIWFPVECKDSDYVVKIDEGSIQLNRGIEPERFAPIEFPLGCKVTDNIHGLWYTVGGFDDPSYEPKTPLEEVLKQLRDREVEVDPTFGGDLINILRDFRIFDDREKWCAAVRGLTLIGKPTVPVLVDELKRTSRDKPNTQSALAFTLRAIGDPSAVPALIDALGSCGRMSDFGLCKPKTDLDRFMKRHQADPRRPGVGFQTPGWEIAAALEKLTGHSEGYRHLTLCDRQGKPIPCGVAVRDSVPMEKPQAVARRWRRWWQNNKDRVLGHSMPPQARYRRSNSRRRARW
jgi:hypothetical protein